MRHNRPLIFTAAVWAALLPGCALEEGAYEQKNQALNPWASASLAYPEYDLNVVADSFWMHDATGPDIEAKMAEGFRLHDVDYIGNGHLTATFVSNTDEYARDGNGFAHGLTDAAFQAIVADTTRRIVDIAQRGEGSGRRWAVAWIANTGSQARTTTVVTDLTREAFQALVGGGLRVMSLVVGANGLFNAVMIPNENSDARRQYPWWGRPDTLRTHMETNSNACRIDPAVNCLRIAEIAQTAVDEYYIVMEDTQKVASPYTGNGLLGVGEQTWLVAGLSSIPGGWDRPNSIQHVTRRLAARPTKLKSYRIADGSTRYMAVMVANGDVPQSAGYTTDNPAIQRLDALLRQQVRQAGLSGLTFGLMKDGQLIHTKAFGYRNMQTNEALQPSDSVRIASISKQLTKAAILRLIEDRVPLPALPGRPGGPITLNTRPFGDVFPYDVPTQIPNLGQLTIYDFLYHQTGLRYDDRETCADFDPAGPAANACDPFQWLMEVEDWVTTERSLQEEFGDAGAFYMHKLGIPYDPTTVHEFNPTDPHEFLQQHYKNANYHLLGHVITALTGLSYADYVNHKFLSPLNLDGLRISRLYEAPEFPNAIQAANYARPEFANLKGPDERGDFILDNAARYPASSYIASPPHILRWQASIAGSAPGYRGIQDYSQMRDYSTETPPMSAVLDNDIKHGGDLTDATVSYINEVKYSGSTYVYFWAATSTPMNHGLGASRSGMFALNEELNFFIAAERAALPVRDLFPTYVQPPCGQYFHDLPIEDWHGCLDYQQALGLTPRILTVNPQTQRVAGAFESAPIRLSHYLLPSATYLAVAQQQAAIGSYPLATNIIPTANGPRFTAIWDAPHPAGMYSYWDATPQAFGQMYHDAQANGFLLTDFFPYEDNGPKFLGTWRKTPTDGYTIATNIPPADFAAMNAQWQAAGHKITHFVTSVANGQTRYAATWERLSGQYELELDTSSVAYSAKLNSRVAGGWTLVHLHSFDADSFASIWHKPAPAGGTFSFETAGAWSKTTGPATLGTSWGTAGKSLTLTSHSTETEIVTGNIPATEVRANSPTGVVNRAAVDIFIPVQQPNPHYVGQLKLHISILSAGRNHQYQGEVGLSNLPRGQFVTVQIPLTTQERNLIATGNRNVKAFLGITGVTGAPPFALDNLRFLP